MCSRGNKLIILSVFCVWRAVSWMFLSRWKCCVWAKIWKVNVEEGCTKACGATFVLGTCSAFALGQRINHKKP